jgi:hypothetical protein
MSAENAVPPIPSSPANVNVGGLVEVQARLNKLWTDHGVLKTPSHREVAELNVNR